MVGASGIAQGSAQFISNQPNDYPPGTSVSNGTAVNRPFKFDALIISLLGVVIVFTLAFVACCFRIFWTHRMTPNSCLASHPCVDTTPPLNGGIVQQADAGDGSGVANISMTAVIHPNDEVSVAKRMGEENAAERSVA
ncbi:g1228 [Coccomyxa elongata]